MAHIDIINLGDSRTIVISSLGSKRSPTLCYSHFSRIHLTVGLGMGSHRDARRNTYIGRHRSESREETYVIRIGTQSHLSLHVVDVGGIDCISLGIQLECSGQTDVESAYAGVLHIAVEREAHRNRAIGIIANELLRHVACKAHDILFAYIRQQSQIHLSGILLVEGIQVHITLQIDIGVGSGERHPRQTHLDRVERYSSTETAQHNAALLLHTTFHNLQSSIGIAV